MIKIEVNRLNEIKTNFNDFKIAIIGDMMLDSYLWGKVSRISPEAPVPIVEIDNEFFRFGGAANVAFNIAKLGATPLPFGVIGNDKNGEIFIKLLEKENISGNFLIRDDKRPTTTKTRVISSDQQIVRIDKENKTLISADVENNIYATLEKNIGSIDAIILEDYNKGLLSSSLIKRIITLGLENKKIISVDPKFDNFFEYKNTTVFKPNLKESEEALGVKISSKGDIEKIGTELLNKLNCNYVLLTLGANGMAIFDKNNKPEFIPTKARKVLDVSGAGDTVISTLTLSLLAGASITEATYLSNYAGGLVCEEAGVVPIEFNKLFKRLESELK